MRRIWTRTPFLCSTVVSKDIKTICRYGMFLEVPIDRFPPKINTKQFSRNLVLARCQWTCELGGNGRGRKPQLHYDWWKDATRNRGIERFDWLFHVQPTKFSGWLERSNMRESLNKGSIRMSTTFARLKSFQVLSNHFSNFSERQAKCHEIKQENIWFCHSEPRRHELNVRFVNKTEILPASLSSKTQKAFHKLSVAKPSWPPDGVGTRAIDNSNIWVRSSSPVASIRLGVEVSKVLHMTRW